MPVHVHVHVHVHVRVHVHDDVHVDVHIDVHVHVHEHVRADDMQCIITCMRQLFGSQVLPLLRTCFALVVRLNSRFGT